MKNLLKFFLEVEKLKQMPRTGWVLMNVQKPETVAAHTFRMTVLASLLAIKKNLNIKKIIQTALFHDLCEVYAEDVTPFFYYLKLPKDKIQRKKVLMKWIRLSKKEKEKLGEKKFKLEKESLLKLTKLLNPEIRKKIYSSWFNFEKRVFKEGSFVKQVDRIETLIQSIEYFGPKEEVGGSSWWEGTEEVVEDTLLLNFLKVIQKKFYGKTIKEYKKDEELENILDFILEIGKLKKMPRTIWVSMGIKNPETVAGHVFTTTLMTWVFGFERKEIDFEKSLKMALCHEFPSVYTGDLITPFILPKEEKEKRKVFERWPRLEKKEKEKIFFEDYQKEKKAIEKLTQKLEQNLKKEIIGLWEEYKMNLTPEALFVNQINVLAVLLEALLYQKKDKNLPIGWIWEWAFEKCECPTILKFLEELKEKFYKKSLIKKAFFKIFGIK
jgi:5'-deoxynucleotidase YfbR-like HD superfamily hydrolase